MDEWTMGFESLELWKLHMEARYYMGIFLLTIAFLVYYFVEKTNQGSLHNFDDVHRIHYYKGRD